MHRPHEAPLFMPGYVHKLRLESVTVQPLRSWGTCNKEPGACAWKWAVAPTEQNHLKNNDTITTFTNLSPSFYHFLTSLCQPPPHTSIRIQPITSYFAAALCIDCILHLSPIESIHIQIPDRARAPSSRHPDSLKQLHISPPTIKTINTMADTFNSVTNSVANGMSIARS